MDNSIYAITIDLELGDKLTLYYHNNLELSEGEFDRIVETASELRRAMIEVSVHTAQIYIS